MVALAVTLGQLITSALAAYALAIFEFPGKTFFFFVFLGDADDPLGSDHRAQLPDRGAAWAGRTATRG